MSNSKLHTRSSATRKPDAGLSTVFMGVAMRFTNNTRDYAVVIHDGMGIVGSERDVHHGDMPGTAVDRLLDALMRGADIACQVSTREGFEIKVTEAIHKRRWIIATKAGGIPLQIRDGLDGTLVPPGDPRAIADAMLDFYGSGKYERMREVDGNHVDRPLGGRWTGEGEGPREELFTIGNATMWHFLWNSVMGFTKEENGDEELVRRFDFGSGENDLWTLDGKMVWDLLKIKNASN
ncbi:hypothetical protein EXIGLDRAFT_764100 [Exidia glandulosa HHB12029]|uniref:Uncharacterized protein n=1 Tax=Exidia glandulosa HHB12029 TaxID=1314781 RepID=A0A165LDX2_EXIGL|nr:hypothetical protein EXIGLDRAFT_764100 [Exidia glandulosa HHB12029]